MKGFAQEPFIKYRSLLFVKEISSKRMGNGKWENGEWEMGKWIVGNWEWENKPLFFRFIVWYGVLDIFQRWLSFCSDKKKLPSLELKLIDILKDILFVTRLASGSDMINIGRHIRKVLKKISISVSQLSPYWIFLFLILMLETFQRKYLSTFPSPLMKIPWLTSSYMIIKSHMV